MKRLLFLFLSVCVSFVGFANNDCIATSVGECEVLKAELEDHAQKIQKCIDDNNALVDEVRSSAQDSLSDLQYSKYDLDDALDIVSSLGPLVCGLEFHDDPSVQDKAGQILEGLSQLDMTLSWVADGIDSALDGVGSSLDSLELDFSDIQNFTATIDCEACADCGDGGGGAGGGGSGSGGCPCEDAIDAAKAVLDDIDYRLEQIRQQLYKLDQIISSLNKIKSDVSDTREYLLEDQKVKLNDILTAIKSIKGVNALLYSDYTNATKFVTSEGSSWSMLTKAFVINQKSGDYSFDYGEYSSLSWFSRVEFLLGHIAGIWYPTNSTASADFDQETKAQVKVVEDDSAWQDSNYETHKESILDLIDSVKECIESINPFSGCFDSSTSPNKITILPDVSVESDLLGNTFPGVDLELDNSGDGSFSYLDVIDLCHNILTFLYFVGFALVDIFAIYKFVAFLIFVNGWYWKVYHSWVSTMFNGGGR